MELLNQLAANTTLANHENDLIASLIPNRDDGSRILISDQKLPLDLPRRTDSSTHTGHRQTKASNPKIRYDPQVQDPNPEPWNNDDYEHVLMACYAMVNPYPLYAVAYSVDVGLSEPRLANSWD